MTKKRPLASDGLAFQDNVGEWSCSKYRLHAILSKIFAEGMKKQGWQHLIYLDLFSGPGLVRVRGTRNFEPSAGMNAVLQDPPFTRYVFAEKDPELLEALRQRVQEARPGLDCRFELGDSNENLGNILRHVPKVSKRLTFCFVDPFGLGQLKMSTLRQVRRSGYTDFLILLPIGMDANRNWDAEFKNLKRRNMTEALDRPRWREEWNASFRNGARRKSWFADRFCERMEAMGYLPNCRRTMKPVRSTGKNLDLYHLAFFSRHKTGYTYFRQAIKYSTEQGTLFALE